MSFTIFEKSPTSTLDYTLDWSQYLQDGQTITASSWSADSGVTVENDIKTSNSTTVFVSGGSTGDQYFVSNTITTNDDLVVTRSFILKIVFR